MSLEDMSAKFDDSLTRHGREKLTGFKRSAKKGGTAASQGTNGVEPDAADGTEEDGTEG
jgi:hypothetical protein